jgi:hypothetical protein
MNSRERVNLALNHQEPDRVPLDLGGCGQTGMHVDTVYRLRQALGLDAPGTPVKVVEPYQMLGEIKPDLMEVLGVDVVGLWSLGTLFGFRNEGWKPWTTFAGTPVLVPEGFNTDVEEDGSLYLYAGGDKSYPPSGKMPAGGYFFDSVPRQHPIVEEDLKVEDNLEEFGVLSDADLDYMHREAVRLYEETDKAIMLLFPGTGFGDIALVPAPMLKDPKGIRDVTEWYMSTVTRQDFIYEIFERQADIAMKNLEKVFEAVGNRPSVAWMSGADFGTQTSQFMSTDTYRKLFMPHHKRVNDWIHENTTWKTLVHTDGALIPLIPLFIEEGFDIMNPVQITAAGMDPHVLKSRFGDQLTFWGAGVDTQWVLPFGTPDEVRQQVRENLDAFAPGGGLVFSTIHNVMAEVPVENLIAMYETLRDYGAYGK